LDDMKTFNLQYFHEWKVWMSLLKSCQLVFKDYMESEL
jgi:nicotinic acid mononucleotide adenylyltransferase